MADRGPTRSSGYAHLIGETNARIKASRALLAETDHLVEDTKDAAPLSEPDAAAGPSAIPQEPAP